MRLLVTPLLIVLAVLGFAACGGDDKNDTPTPAEAEVIATVKSANAAFASGDYAKTCTYYTVELAQKLVEATKSKNCRAAWAAIAKNLEKAQPDAKIRAAVQAYAPNSATIKGDIAEARFGEPPAVLKKAYPGLKAGNPIALRKVGGRWAISTLAQLG